MTYVARLRSKNPGCVVCLDCTRTQWLFGDGRGRQRHQILEPHTAYDHGAADVADRWVPTMPMIAMVRSASASYPAARRGFAGDRALASSGISRWAGGVFCRRRQLTECGRDLRCRPSARQATLCGGRTFLPIAASHVNVSTRIKLHVPLVPTFVRARAAK